MNLNFLPWKNDCNSINQSFEKFQSHSICFLNKNLLKTYNNKKKGRIKRMFESVPKNLRQVTFRFINQRLKDIINELHRRHQRLREQFRY